MLHLRVGAGSSGDIVASPGFGPPVWQWVFPMPALPGLTGGEQRREHGMEPQGGSGEEFVTVSKKHRREYGAGG